MNIIWQLIACLPELIRLIGELERKKQVDESERKIKHDIQAINEAFATEDATKLNAILSRKRDVK